MEFAWKVGDVLHFYNYVASKNKFHVVACTEPEMLTLLINSEMNRFFNDKPNMVACHVNIDRSRHPFLSHDSIIFCCEVHSGPRDHDTVDHVGEIDKDLWPSIEEAVRVSPTLGRRFKKWILSEKHTQ